MDVMLGDGLAKPFTEAVGIGVTEMSEVAIGPGDDVVSRLVGAKEGDVKFVFCSFKHAFAWIDAVWQVEVAEVIETRDRG